MSVNYDGIHPICGDGIDILVDAKVEPKSKSVEKLAGFREAQLLTYMGLAKVERELPINFKVRRLVDDVKRYRTQLSVRSVFSVVSYNRSQLPLPL